MAEGGKDDTVIDPDIGHDDDDDDEEQEVDRTQPFQTSTPYHGGGIELQTRHQENTGLQPSYEETSFSEREHLLGAQFESQLSWDALTRVFPEASATSLETSFSNRKRLQVKMAGYGKKLYDLFTTNKKTGKQQLNPQLSKEIKNALGKSIYEIIEQDRDTVQEQRKRLEEAEKQQREAEKIAAEREKELREMENLKQQTERTQARIDALQEEHGSNLESEAELQRLIQLKKNHQTEYENKKKEVAALEKQAKNKQKAEEKVSRERAKLEEIVKKRNLMEERLNSTKPLDDLNEREAQLQTAKR